jgi:hypothetical protein
MKQLLYTEGLKNRELDKEAAQIFWSKRGTVLEDTARSKDEKYDAKPTPAKTDFSVTRCMIQLGVCVGIFGCCLFSYLEKQNDLTHVKIRLPELEREIASVREEIRRMRYEIDQYENPAHLIELSHRPEFSHLKHPLLKEILTVPEAIALNE